MKYEIEYDGKEVRLSVSLATYKNRHRTKRETLNYKDAQTIIESQGYYGFIPGANPNFTIDNKFTSLEGKFVFVKEKKIVDTPQPKMLESNKAKAPKKKRAYKKKVATKPLLKMPLLDEE
jgi:hypothetical protein